MAARITFSCKRHPDVMTTHFGGPKNAHGCWRCGMIAKQNLEAIMQYLHRQQHPKKYQMRRSPSGRLIFEPLS